MYDLTDLFRPATAQPFMNTLYYSEEAPCAALKPYIRCFWGTARPVSGPEPPSERKSLVIPDGCVDIIFRADLDRGQTEAYFCGLDENGWESGRAAVHEGLTATFAVRFYLWSAAAFAEDTLINSSNTAFPAERLFPGFVREMREYLSRGLTLRQNAEHAERLLLTRLIRQPDENLMNALELTISRQGRVSCAELSLHTGCTVRRLQRLFNENIGASPKSVMSVIRYQLMWQEMLRDPHFSVLDAVEKYGYFDQPHLLHDFKRRHLMTPQEALRQAHGRKLREPTRQEG